MVLDAVRRHTPAWVNRVVPGSVRDRVSAATERSVRSSSAYAYLHGLMGRYTVEHLVHMEPAAFEAGIRSFLDLRDPDMEGYRDPTRQRDLSIRFHWGHDHDFGSFALRG